jgi:hypothetical protein
METPRFASCWRPRLRTGVATLSCTAPMCRAAPKRHPLAKVPACAPRHIGAHWTATLPRSQPALAPGNASLALRNARLPKDAFQCASVPRPRVSAPMRAARHCAAALRKLRAASQSRFVDHHPPQPTPPALAPGTAPLALRNARLTKTRPGTPAAPALPTQMSPPVTQSLAITPAPRPRPPARHTPHDTATLDTPKPHYSCDADSMTFGQWI